jgi:hypothetical protein
LLLRITSVCYKRPHDGWQLEPKHVAVNKMIQLVLIVTDLIHILVNKMLCSYCDITLYKTLKNVLLKFTFKKENFL